MTSTVQTGTATRGTPSETPGCGIGPVAIAVAVLAILALVAGGAYYLYMQQVGDGGGGIPSGE